MKVSRNQSCPCGSNKKYKQCCGKDSNSEDSFFNRFKPFVIIGFIAFFSITIYGVIEYYQSDRPEMEAYKCDKPGCDQWHYRPVES